MIYCIYYNISNILGYFGWGEYFYIVMLFIVISLESFIFTSRAARSLTSIKADY